MATLAGSAAATESASVPTLGSQAEPAVYGSQVPPGPPRQDMYAIDPIAGGPVQDRTASPADFTGGNLGRGLGGAANPAEMGTAEGAAVLGERIGI